MDVLSLFAAVVAVSLFPGGAYAAAMAGGMATTGRLANARVPWSSTSLAAAVLLLFAAALVPLPGAPSATLPLDNGAAANLLAVLLLTGAGLGLGTSPAWPRTRLVAAGAVLAPLFVLAAAAATLDLPVILALPGGHLGAARALAGATLLLAAPVLAPPGDPGRPRAVRALGLAVPALLAAVLIAPPGWSGLPPAACAAMVFGGAVVYAALAGVVDTVGRSRALPPSAIATATSIASITVAAIALH